MNLPTATSTSRLSESIISKKIFLLLLFLMLKSDTWDEIVMSMLIYAGYIEVVHRSIPW